MGIAEDLIGVGQTQMKIKIDFSIDLIIKVHMFEGVLPPLPMCWPSLVSTPVCLDSPLRITGSNRCLAEASVGAVATLWVLEKQQEMLGL